jgi:hypothetical protein
MARPQTAAGFTVEVFVEQNQVAPMRVRRVFLYAAVTRAFAMLVRQKDARQPARKLVGDFLQRHHISGAHRALDLESFAKEKVVTL